MPNVRRRNLALVVPTFLVAFLTTLVATAAQSPSWFRLTDPGPSIHEASRLASWSGSSASPRRIAAETARLASLPAGRRPDLRASGNRQTEPSAPEILERANRRYLEARTYRDVATATTRLTEPGTDRELSPPQVLALETAFIRGGGCLWRFEERGAGHPPRPCVVWTPDGSQWSSHWALDGQLRRFGANPAMALAPTSGISNGANALILPLLLGDAVRPLLGRGATHLRAPLVAGREVIGDVECDVVRGASPLGNDEVALWIDGSGAIRRFERRRTVDPSRLAMPAAGADGAAPMKPFVARTTVDFQPTFDGGIPAKDLDFQPPPVGAAVPTVEEPPTEPRDA